MAEKETTEAASSTSRGDRIVQIVLLVLIGLGILGIILLRLEDSGSSKAGGPPGMSAEDDSEDNIPAVQVSEAAVGTVKEFIRVNGDVDTETSVSIYPDADGKLISILVSLGDYVRRGQSLAVVDPSLPGQVYGKSDVLSTIDGTITAVNVDLGETVDTTTAVATVGNLSSLEVVTYIPERYVGSVNLGTEADISLDAYPDETFPAHVTEISPVLDLTSRTQEISLAFDDPDPRVKVGMFASTQIVVHEAVDAVTVPPSAVTTYYDQDVVFVVNGDTVERRNVTVGLSTMDKVEIVDGLDIGETVVSRGLSGITDGSQVRVVE